MTGHVRVSLFLSPAGWWNLPKVYNLVLYCFFKNTSYICLEIVKIINSLSAIYVLWWAQNLVKCFCWRRDIEVLVNSSVSVFTAPISCMRSKIQTVTQVNCMKHQGDIQKQPDCCSQARQWVAGTLAHHAGLGNHLGLLLIFLSSQMQPGMKCNQNNNTNNWRHEYYYRREQLTCEDDSDQASPDNGIMALSSVRPHFFCFLSCSTQLGLSDVMGQSLFWDIHYCQPENYMTAG